MFRNKMDDLKQSGLANISNKYQFVLPQRQRPILQLKQAQLQLIDWHTRNKYRQPTSCPNKFNIFKQPVSRKKYFANNFHLNSQIKQKQLIKFGVQIPKCHDSLTTLDIQGATSNTILPLSQKNVYYAHKIQKQLGVLKVNNKNLKQQRIKTLGDYENMNNHLPILTKQQQLKDQANYRKFNILTPNGLEYNEMQNKKNNLKSKVNSHRNLSLNTHLIQQKIDLSDSNIRIEGDQNIKLAQKAKLKQKYEPRSISSIQQKIKTQPHQNYQNYQDYQNQEQYPSYRNKYIKIEDEPKGALDHALYQNAQNQPYNNPQQHYNNLYGKVSPTYLSSINGLSSNNGMFLGQYKSRLKLHPLQKSKIRLQNHKKMLQEAYKSKNNFRKYLKSNKL